LVRRIFLSLRPLTLTALRRATTAASTQMSSMEVSAAFRRRRDISTAFTSMKRLSDEERQVQSDSGHGDA
jgi:hypothetical protein